MHYFVDSVSDMTDTRDMTDIASISQSIRNYRRSHGLTLARMAKKARMQIQQLWKLENSKIKTPQVKTLAKLDRSFPDLESYATGTSRSKKAPN